MIATQSMHMMLYNLDCAGRTTWATNIKQLLFKYGFGFVWISQNIGDINIFLTTFKQRLIDCSKQDWYGKIEITDKLYTYATFKSLLEVEKYLNCINVNKYKVALSRFRCSNHVLNIECGRWKNVERNERLCELCSRINIYDIKMSIISYYVVTHIMILETNIYHLLFVQRKVS